MFFHNLRSTTLPHCMPIFTTEFVHSQPLNITMMVDVNKISDLLKEHFKIDGAYEIDPLTGLVNVSGDISVTDDWRVMPITRLPVNFGHVTGDFLCENERMVSLKGSPHLVDGSFYCTNSKLTSLKGAPKRVGGTFNCYNNRLKTLKGAPVHVGDDFWCGYNQLTSLLGAPDHVGGSVYAEGNPLKSLEGAPTHVRLIFEVTWDPALPLLRSLAYSQARVSGAPAQVEQIISKYAGQGKAAALNCALELKQAGFEGNARW